jgi:hypothetical protein
MVVPISLVNMGAVTPTTAQRSAIMDRLLDAITDNLVWDNINLAKRNTRVRLRPWISPRRKPTITGGRLDIIRYVSKSKVGFKKV